VLNSSSGVNRFMFYLLNPHILVLTSFLTSCQSTRSPVFRVCAVAIAWHSESENVRLICDGRSTGACSLSAVA
jgi:hypothetical protein